MVLDDTAIQANRERIISLLNSTGRENVDRLIDWMDHNSFFEAPASGVRHNNFRGGLAKHSLDVYDNAINMNAAKGLPITSITLCALLHDICKADQFYMDANGKAQCNRRNEQKGHGIRSMFIVTRGCALPLNYDEAMAIWWHMGKNEKSKDRFPKEYNESKTIPLVELINKADGKAASDAVQLMIRL